MRSVLFLLMGLISQLGMAQDYPTDDAHNHDGTHVDGQTDCGSNYMLPGSKARLGSHSFIILGEDGPNHILLDHRSGTPPHTYHFILRVKVDSKEMSTYRKLLSESKIGLPAVTTIYFDKEGNQVDRTFFCLPDLMKIFGPTPKSKDEFDKLFPIRASWQKDADFEGAFPIKQTVVPEDPLVIERSDVQVILYRYLPSYLEQKSFRELIKKLGAPFTSLLSHAPIRADEKPESASRRASYVKSPAFHSNGETCPPDYYLKQVRPPKTRHNFLLLSEAPRNSVVAVHLYDQSPQNFQSVVHLQLSDSQIEIFRKARQKSKTPVLFAPDQYFCMAEIRQLVEKKSLNLLGKLFINSEYEEFKVGQEAGTLDVKSDKINVLVNRTLLSLLNPQTVAFDVFGLIDIKTINPDILVEAVYSGDRNFVGKPLDGYLANKCYLTTKAASALDQVQKEISKDGYSLLVYDCYRPQKAVTQMVKWTRDGSDVAWKEAFYPDVAKDELIEKGYIAERSGHSRGSSVDVTLVHRKKFFEHVENDLLGHPTDCRRTKNSGNTGLLDMGTMFDCFSELSHTENRQITEEARRNRLKLRSIMEKYGFRNYPKEWWHFVLSNEPYTKDHFDLDIQ